MENKTTTELLDLLSKLSEEKLIGKPAADTTKQWMSFANGSLLLNYSIQIMRNLYLSAWEAIKDLQEEIKKLKRHKHDSETADVLRRI